MIIPYKNRTIFAFSDTHGLHSRLTIPSEADILICAGDGINGIEKQELSDFFNWYAAQPALLRIFVAGNHELLFDLCPDEARLLIPRGIRLLENSGNMMILHSILLPLVHGYIKQSKFQMK